MPKCTSSMVQYKSIAISLASVEVGCGQARLARGGLKGAVLIVCLCMHFKLSTSTYTSHKSHSLSQAKLGPSHGWWLWPSLRFGKAKAASGQAKARAFRPSWAIHNTTEGVISQGGVRVCMSGPESLSQEVANMVVRLAPAHGAQVGGITLLNMSADHHNCCKDCLFLYAA
jgi:hypothetical protein